MLQKVYDNLSVWSQKPYGEHILFWFALAESCIIPVPADPLLLALCTGHPQRSLRFAIICGMGSVLGGVLGYAIGYYAFESIGSALLQLYDPQMEVFHRVEDIYTQWGFWGVLMAAVTPIPYKVFTLTSGVFNFNFGQFLLASVIGRNVRFLFVGGLMAFGGDRVQTFIESSSDRLLWVCLILVVAGLFAVKLI
ncbi:DedA family protein [Oscillatoria sp. CS-180]|uniref:YqaA family protein n=1 Tax=Oscillatoria sp. CS-180 TaxID=3021720 RepID=UPI00232CE073|nr:YqaA family protein [Oscillatoria sp. CS-180]MDB9529890.1 DedA family protein [Oscillatoria sp. CS-180]